MVNKMWVGTQGYMPVTDGKIGKGGGAEPTEGFGCRLADLFKGEQVLKQRIFKLAKLCFGRTKKNARGR